MVYINNKDKFVFRQKLTKEQYIAWDALARLE